MHRVVDETRVRLKGDPGVEGSDYINASFIDVSTATTVCKKNVLHHLIITGVPQQNPCLHSHTRSESFIRYHAWCVSLYCILYSFLFSCGVGPTELTVVRFWQMIWEQQLSTIVMLTRCVEDGKV